ncbi:MAG TPA: PaaI family thioesterase [Actinomycetota bacterium]|nr:PaaI family thioesterase [Actinomycetota bacterium]
MGIEIAEVQVGRVEAGFDVRPHHLAPNGFLHAGSVVTLADTACGYGCVRALPEGASGFTTAELKANFLSTTTSGRVRCTATLVQGGRTLQVWDATVTDDSERTLAVFRCTQVVLWPR